MQRVGQLLFIGIFAGALVLENSPTSAHLSLPLTPPVASATGAKNVETKALVNIPLSLPTSVTVTGRDGERAGQIIDMNARELTLSRSNRRATVPIADIETVKFDEDAPLWWPDEPTPVIRGDNDGGIRQSDEASTFTVKMTGFKWENKQNGIAIIVADAVVECNGEPGIPRDVVDGLRSDNRRYVVEEIRFELDKGLMIVTARSSVK
ncbi:hypothetical protein [[Phormidium] sp. ETS-05]|uniref:hypothetical protein n=1 Tax=[Phormidium] sp. ETS-05 TaxID=222819 RepID=UPI0018EF1883|nr:hypothetical protein [[Phormidium] sp. ETS-05]